MLVSSDNPEICSLFKKLIYKRLILLIDSVRCLFQSKNDFITITYKIITLRKILNINPKKLISLINGFDFIIMLTNLRTLVIIDKNILVITTVSDTNVY